MNKLWSPERDFVGYGGTPPSVSWPNGKSVALSVVINFEEGAETAIADGDEVNEIRAELPLATPISGRDIAVESYYEYGSRVGYWRIMRLLKELEVPATIFACAQALERNPNAARDLAESNHEVCSHGYRWIMPSTMTEDEERESISQAVRSLEQSVGRRPVGWYCRYGPSERTRRLLIEHGGFLYDSDSYADDLPFTVRQSGVDHLVVPYSLENNDIKFWAGQPFGGPSDFVDHLKRSLDVLLSEASLGPQMMSVGLHLRIAGRPARFSAVREFLEYAKDQDGVWFATREQIARRWIEQTQPKS